MGPHMLIEENSFEQTDFFKNKIARLYSYAKYC